MSEDNNIESENTNSAILYDLASYTKWTSEINLSKEQNAYVKYQKNQINNYNFIFKFGAWVKNRLKLRSNENNFKFIFNSSKPWNQWKLCVSKSENNNYIAVLQENLIEVYTDFSNLVWRTEINTKFVKICNLFLNERHDMLCFSDEYGNMIIYNVNSGEPLYKYEENDSIEFENAICKAFFIEADTVVLKKTEHEVIDLVIITVTYSGYYNVFTINENKTITKIYTHSLLNVVPNGIYCAEIDEKNQYLIIGSNAINTSKVNSNGLFIWRVLNSEPWLKHVPISEDLSRNKSPNKYLAKVNFTKIEYVTKLEIEPNNLAVAAVYISGKIAIYSLPTLKLINEWFMTEQPCYNEMNSDIVENPYELKTFKQIYSEPDFRVSDIGWWTTKVLILTRGTGLLSLVSSEDLTNMMGRNQQWLSPFPSIYPYQKNGFIILDCACSLVSQADTDLNSERGDASLINESSTSSELNNYTDDDDVDEDDDSWYTYIKEILKSQMYNLSGIERFKALPKRPKFLKRKFSILHFKSTTPGELFKRKLASEEYGEALQLAKTYKLDTDLVYQKQWRSKPISKSTIIDYLSKIKKRSWVLQECLTRVSPNIDTTKYLIDFGLRGTDLDSLIAIKEEDDNRFVYSQKEDFADEFDDSTSDIFNPEYLRRKKERLERIRQEKLSKININNLTLAQKQLCQVRLKLLKYMDRLNVYELILGGAIKAAELFDPEKFQQIRSKSILEFTIDYAREGNADAVEILFSYFDKELKHHQLEVLSNFPETMYPEDTYAKLLPTIEYNEVKIFNYPEDIRDEKDWIESPEFEFILQSDESNQAKSNETNTNLVYTIDMIENWYLNRTIEIENFSGIVEVALSFSKLALANGCRNMNDIIENLQTLFTLVYECKTSSASSQTYFTLDYVASLNELEKLSLIMSHSFETTSELYIKNLQEWLVPFVTRRQTVAKREALLRDYFLKISKEDLNPCLKLLSLKFKTANILNELNLISIFIECLYVNEKPDQIDICNQIVHEISTKTTVDFPTSNLPTKSPQLNKIRISLDLFDKIKTAQLHLRACDLFKKYGVNKTLVYIRDSCLSVENCRDALVKLTWFASKRTSHLKLNEWIDLMKDLQYLQTNIYKSLISYQDCTEIFLTSLLGSRNLENIKLASDWLKDILTVDKESAVNLAVKAAQEYFNASSNYLDPDMDFSKACLNLVKTLLIESKSGKQKQTQHSASDLSDYKSILAEMAKHDPNLNGCIQLIESESDLISAMKIIAEFEYNILPVQVRISTNRVDIIKEILKTNSQAYKEYDKLLTLSSLLRVNTETHCKEQVEVMLLIAEHSLLQENLQVVAQMCNHLVRLNYCPAWSCVYKLAFHLSKNIADQFKIPHESIDYQLDMEMSDFLLAKKKKNSIFRCVRNHDFSAQMNTLFSNKSKTVRSLSEIEKLLSFALTHCDSHFIECILGQKNDIEIARIKLEQSEHTGPLKTSSPTEIRIETLHRDYFCNENAGDFDAFKKTNESVNQAIQSLLENKKRNSVLNKRNLIDNIDDLIRIDASLALGFLLEISDENEANTTQLESLLKYETSISYELALYLFSLNLMSEFIGNEIDYYDLNLNEKSFLYYLKPSSLTQLLEDANDFESSNSFKSFRRINKRFTEYKQNRALKELNAGIDLKRFELDDNYKQDTILGLSMDMNTFELACSLAKFYNFDLWKVYMTFAEHLFEISPHEISLKELKDKIEPLTPLLASRRNEFDQVMLTNVFEMIDGKDLDKLIVFYEFLNDSESEFHIKTLRKIKTISLDSMDYKSLLVNPLETIELFLDDANQQFFAKLLPKLPAASEKNLTSSKIYIVWCTKKVWSLVDEMLGESDLEIEWTPENVNYFSDKFDNLNENLKKLDLETDFVYFAKELLMSQKSCSKLNISVRKNLIKKLIKLFKQLYQQQQSKQDKLNDEKFNKANSVLLSMQNYLKTIETIHKLFEQIDIVKKDLYFQKLDYNLSHYLIESSDATQLLAKLEDTLIELLFNDFDIDLVSNIISLADLKETDIKSLIKTALNKICSLLKEAKDETKKKEHFGKLKVLLDSISSNLDKNESENDAQQQNESKTNKKKKALQRSESLNSTGDLSVNKKKIVNEDVMDCMRVFCNDHQVDLDLRLLILEELKKSIKNMKDEDLMLLLVYKTNAILNNCNKFDNRTELVNSLSIQTESQRLELILKYIDLSEVQEHYVAVINLLKIWPSFTTVEKSPLNCVLVKMFLNKIQFVENVKDLNKNGLITDSDINYIREELEKNAKWNLKDGLLKIAYLKLCLAAKSKKLVRNFVDTIELECFKLDELVKLNDLEDEIKCESMQSVLQDKELMHLLLEDHLYSQIMNTPLYSLFTYYMLRNEAKHTIYDLVRYLKQKENFTTEAAKLLLDVDRFHSSYKTLSVSLTLLDKFD